jgi:hypothetical protein
MLALLNMRAVCRGVVRLLGELGGPIIYQWGSNTGFKKIGLRPLTMIAVTKTLFAVMTFNLTS